MAKNASANETRKPVAFVAGRRNRLLRLQVELKDFHEDILGREGRTAETDEILNAMALLIDAIDYEEDSRGDTKVCPHCGRRLTVNATFCYGCMSEVVDATEVVAA